MAEDCEIADNATARTNDWRNVSFFEDVVANDLSLRKGSFSIVDLLVSDANETVAGYMSLMHRATLQVEEEQEEIDAQKRSRGYVVKEKSNQVFGWGVVELMQVFPKEIQVYETFLPAFEALWHREGVQFGPKLFKSVTDTLLVMEDLKSRHFAMKDCSEGLGLADCERVLEKLAKFHAASVVYREQNGPYPDSFKIGMFSESFIEMFEPYYAPLFDSYLHELEEQNFPAPILDAIRSYKGRIYSVLSDLYRYDPSKFNVLNHGDPWVNNLQFSDSDVLLIDYQIAFYGSPSFDVLYFITMSASIDVRTDKFDHLINHYYQNLLQGLQTLRAQTKAPSPQEFQDDIRRHSLIVCALSMEGAMLSLAPDVDKDMDVLCSDSPEGVAYRKRFYGHPRVMQMLQKLVPFLWEKGYLRPYEPVDE